MTQSETIIIKVNDKKIDLNEFTGSILRNTIQAMILSLKLEEEPNTIEIILNN